jgi:hypothetical protein
MIADRPVDAAVAIGMNPDVLRAKDEARAAVTRMMIIDRAIGTSSDVLRVKDEARVAVTTTTIMDRAAEMSQVALQASATGMTTMSGHAVATIMAAL